jgi:2-polyprenyl-3-methyl-5-hydroxy-6-metoxy-1,4-benzoquinol methylase
MSETIVDKVRERYGAVAAGTLSGEHAGVRAVAQAFGYSPEELASLPAEANMGLSCGNPTAFASLRPGEVVVDLGCGGGLDVLLAAGKVGPTGRVVGIDMTPEMLERARANAAKQGASNVEFHQATIDKLPLADASVDCVISNCVINLTPDKPAVFREIARVLKPGGRVAVSDIALKKELPPEVGSNLMAYIGCVAGAISFADYERGLREAGFGSVQIVDTGKDLNCYTQVKETSGSGCGCASSCGTGQDAGGELHANLAELMRRYNVNDYAASVRVFAVKGG